MTIFQDVLLFARKPFPRAKKPRAEERLGEKKTAPGNMFLGASDDSIVYRQGTRRQGAGSNQSKLRNPRCPMSGTPWGRGQFQAGTPTDRAQTMTVLAASHSFPELLLRETGQESKPPIRNLSLLLLPSARYDLLF
jgi:hypothetical protein